MSAQEEDTGGPPSEPLPGIDRRTFLQATGATALIPAGLTVIEEQPMPSPSAKAWYRFEWS
jgi:hypothetical protein